MADNVTLNEGAGGDTVAADDIAGVKHQLVKLEYGDADSATQVSDTNPLPIDDAGGSLTVDAAGDVAHDAADGGNPLKIGAYAVNAEPAAVANADRVNLIADLVGKLITLPYANPESFSDGNAGNTDGTSTQCIAAAGAGVRTYLTTIVLTNTSSTDSYVEIKDGATARLTVPLPANGGAIVNLPVPLRGTANTAWNFDPGAALTTVYCSMAGYKGV